MLKRIYIIGIAILTFFLLVYIFKLNSLHSEKSQGSLSFLNKNIKTSPFIEEKRNSLKFNLPNNENMWLQFIQTETQRISELTNDPDSENSRLKKIAEQIPKNKLRSLIRIVLNFDRPNDQKLLATELLILSDKPESLPLLKEIALSETPSHLSLQLQQEFKSIQAQAIEGIALHGQNENKILALKILNDLNLKINDGFLSDRLQRSLWSLKGLAESPEQQDLKALSQF